MWMDSKIGQVHLQAMGIILAMQMGGSWYRAGVMMGGSWYGDRVMTIMMVTTMWGGTHRRMLIHMAIFELTLW